MRRGTRAMTAMILTMALTVVSAAFAANKMTTWTVDSGRFSVAMPGKPEHTSINRKLPSGETVTAHEYVFESADRRHSYMVMYNDFQYAPNLDGVVAGWAKNGRIVNQKTFTFQGLYGRNAELQVDGYTTFAYAVADGVRLYQILFVASPGASVPPEANEFVQSFRINK